MKIGVITDIHNNILALNAVLEYFAREDCTEILCCGDIIGIGPYPEETVQKIMSTSNLKCVIGNHEKYLIYGLKPPYPDGMQEGEAKHHFWEHSQLSSASKEYIKGLPYKLELERENNKILVLHYAMDNNNNYINGKSNPTLDDCKNMFADYNADIILYGHRHMPSFISSDKKMYINCGSLGCPHNFEGVAKGGILILNDSNVSFEPIKVAYDLNQAIQHIDNIRYSDYEFIKKIFYGVK